MQPITIFAKITTADVTNPVTKDLSGVDAGQLHPRRVCCPNPTVAASLILSGPASSPPLGNLF